MASRIEQIIDELEDYIEGCKYQPLSNNKIIVNKDDITDLLAELRSKTPEEIKRYQKIINNKEAILEDAQQKAQALINAATEQTSELISEHEIMQQAYAQATEVVKLATQQAQQILDDATVESNSVKASAISYTDDILADIQDILEEGIQAAKTHYGQLLEDLEGCLQLVQSNRMALRPEEVEGSMDSSDYDYDSDRENGDLSLDLM